MKKMKRLFALLAACLMLVAAVLPAYAEGGSVTYDGQAQKFIFEPGSKHSPTDLFTEFKDVMPGDSLTQQITVKNNASNKVKVKIYIRSLGAHEESEELLSKLHLKVKTSEENTMAYMFDAAANQSAQLTEWYCLGTLFSGGTVNLDVTLDVPVELDNKYSNQIGYLDWEFKIEEFEIDPDDPDPPQTGEDPMTFVWAGVAVASALLGGVLLIVLLKKKRKDEENTVA